MKTISVILLVPIVVSVAIFLFGTSDSNEPGIEERKSSYAEDSHVNVLPQVAGVAPSFQSAGHDSNYAAANGSGNGDHIVSNGVNHEKPQDIVTLWDTDPMLAPTNEEVPSEYIHADVSTLASLSMASQVEVYIPQTGQQYSGEVVEENTIVPGVTHMNVVLDGVASIYRMSINRGSLATYIWIATPEGVFNVEIDGKSGVGKITSNADIVARWPMTNDTVIEKQGAKEIEPPPEI